MRENKMREEIKNKDSIVDVKASVPEEDVKTTVEAPEVTKASETDTDTPQPIAPDTLSAHNPEGIEAAEREGAESDEEIEFASPMFFAEDDDRFRVELDILYNKNGLVQSISSTTLGVDFSDLTHLKHVQIWFEFSIPGYEDVATYRQRSAVYNAQAQGMVIDRIQFRNFLLAWHLKDWSLTGRDGKKMELNSREDGRLDDESLQRVYALRPPTLVDVLLSVFEKDALLSAINA